MGIALITGKGANNQTFFVANRSSPWYLVAFGMVGASLSGVTFISVPGWVGDSGFTYFQVVLGYWVGYVFVALILLPIYYQYNLTSIYEYLNLRFGPNSHKIGAIFFLISRVIGASFRLFLVSIVLQQFIFNAWQIPFEVTVILSVILIWVYTHKGGIKTIVWTDTLQTLLMLTAVGLTIYHLGNELNLNLSEILTENRFQNYTRTWVTRDLMVRNHFLKSFIGGVFITICMTGLDQDMMQKNLSCKNLKLAQLNMLTFSGVLVFVNFIFLVLGALLFSYYQETNIGSTALEIIGRTDLLFAEIANSGSLGYGVGILFLLGLIAAAYSSADSALTSLTTSFTVDFMNIETKSSAYQERIRKIVHVIMSLVLVLVIIILRKTSDDSAIWLLIKLAGFTYGPLIALFFFGILTKRKLLDQYVPIICVSITFILALIWGVNNYKLISWFGEYQFGAEIIIYNSLISFALLFLVSKKVKS